MTNDEIKAHLDLVEEKTKNRIGSVDNQIDKVDSRITALHAELKHFKENHNAEHTHNENENNLKIELYQQQFKQLSDTVAKISSDFEKEKDREIGKRQLSLAEKGILTAVIIFLISTVLNFFNINIDTFKNNPTEQSKQEAKK